MKNKINTPTFDLKRLEDIKVAISQVSPMDLNFGNRTVTEYELLVLTIYRLNELIKVTNEYTDLINEIMLWILNEGLEESVLNQLNVWLDDGTLENLINDTLFNKKADKTVVDVLIERVNNIEVGGVNYLPDSEIINIPLGSASKAIFTDEVLKTGTNITVSYEDFVTTEPYENDRVLMMARIVNTTPSQYIQFVINIDEKKVTRKLTGDVDRLLIYSGTGAHNGSLYDGTFTKLKVEKGTMATSWTPSLSEFFMKKEFQEFKLLFDALVIEVGGKLSKSVYDQDKIVQEGINTLIREDINQNRSSISEIKNNLFYYNVLYSGIVGDGVTDQTSSLNSVFNDYLYVYLPKGNYVISDTINLENVTVIFDEECVFTVNNNNSLPIFNIGNKTTVDGLKLDVINKNSIGLNILGNDISIKNVFVKNIKNIGIEGNECTNLLLDNVTVTNSDTRYVNLVGAFRINNSKNVIGKNLKVYNSYGKGLVFSRCEFVNLENVITDGVFERQPSFYSARGKELTLTNYKATNTRAGLKISRGSVKNFISNVFIETGLRQGVDSDYALFVQGGSGNVIENVEIRAHEMHSCLRIEQHPDPEGANSYNNIVKNVVILADDDTSFGLYLQNRSDGYSNNKVTIDNVVIQGTKTYGIRLDGGKDILLDNLDLRGAKGIGLQISVGAKNVTVRNSYISSMNNSIIASTENVLIDNCVFSVEDETQYHLNTGGSKNLIISNTRIESNGLGIRTTIANGLTIKNCLIKSVPNAITLQSNTSSKDVIIVDNMTVGNISVASTVSNTVIENNILI